jgi:hypothetical protein
MAIMALFVVIVLLVIWFLSKPGTSATEPPESMAVPHDIDVEMYIERISQKNRDVAISDSEGVSSDLMVERLSPAWTR